MNRTFYTRVPRTSLTGEIIIQPTNFILENANGRLNIEPS